MLLQLFPHSLVDEEGNLVFRHRLPGRGVGLDRRGRRVRQKRGVGFVVVFFGRLSAYVFAVAGVGILRPEVFLALGSLAVRRAVCLVAAESGTRESSAARDHRIRGGFGAGGHRGEGWGAFWHQENPGGRALMASFVDPENATYRVNDGFPNAVFT